MFLFIGGTPASGKSTLAEDLAKSLEQEYMVIGTDDIRRNLKEIPNYRKWIDIYRNIDEIDFMKNRSCEQKLEILISQSKNLFPPILEEMKSLMKKNKNIIFEGVTILPSLAKCNLDFDGIYLVLNDKSEFLGRLEKRSRWGKTKELHKMEVDYFVDCEAAYYEKEAKRHGYMFFTDYTLAKNALLSLAKKLQT